MSTQQIPPQPLPTRVNIDWARGDGPNGRPVTLLRWDVQTPAGICTFFGDREFSASVAVILNQHLGTWPGELALPSPLDLEALRGRLNGGRRDIDGP